MLSTTLPPEGGSSTAYTYELVDPCPTRGGAILILDRGPRDQWPLETYDDLVQVMVDIRDGEEATVRITFREVNELERD
jgi:hypothetical protein